MSELGSLAQSLYTCIKHYIYDDAVLSIDTCLGLLILLNTKMYSAEKLQVGHVAARRGWLKR